MAKNIVRLLAFLLLISWATSSSAASLLLITAPGERSQTIEAVEFMSEAYGISIVNLFEKIEDIYSVMSKEDVRGIVVTGDSLSALPIAKNVKRILESGKINLVPIFFVDLTERSIKHIENILSIDTPSVSEFINSKNDKYVYKISGPKSIAREISGISFPFDIEKSENTFFFKEIDGREIQKIIEIQALESRESYPILVKTYMFGREAFLMSKFNLKNINRDDVNKSIVSNFLNFSPFAMFIKYSFGKFCWHSDGYYANFTIDDPWLHEPYGNISYHDILNEMKMSNFHTTIAFIPWNFDRNDPSVVRLFKENPNRFSIAIHGNNHDQEEFTKLRGNDIHEKNIKQGIARMEEFQKLTGLEYDKVMIFPHKIASAAVLDLLRKYEFAGTANLQKRLHNGNNISPSNIWIDFVSDENGIPSLKRELPYSSIENLAILLFLNMPLLLHTHHDYFYKDIGKFSKIAKSLNHIQPDLKWVRLEYIFNRLYLKKLESDGKYRVFLFGNKTIVENADDEKRVFLIEKTLPANTYIDEVWVNENRVAFAEFGDRIEFEVDIGGKDRAIIRTKYSDVIHEKVETETNKNDLRIRAVRYASDFRDILIGRTSIGYSIVKSYYSQSHGFIVILIIAVIGFAITFGAAIVLIVRWKRAVKPLH